MRAFGSARAGGVPGPPPYPAGPGCAPEAPGEGAAAAPLLDEELSEAWLGRGLEVLFAPSPGLPAQAALRAALLRRFLFGAQLTATFLAGLEDALYDPALAALAGEMHAEAESQYAREAAWPSRLLAQLHAVSRESGDSVELETGAVLRSLHAVEERGEPSLFREALPWGIGPGAAWLEPWSGPGPEAGPGAPWPPSRGPPAGAPTIGQLVSYNPPSGQFDAGEIAAGVGPLGPAGLAPGLAAPPASLVPPPPLEPRAPRALGAPRGPPGPPAPPAAPRPAAAPQIAPASDSDGILLSAAPDWPASSPDSALAEGVGDAPPEPATFRVSGSGGKVRLPHVVDDLTFLTPEQALWALAATCAYELACHAPGHAFVYTAACQAAPGTRREALGRETLKRLVSRLAEDGVSALSPGFEYEGHASASFVLSSSPAPRAAPGGGAGSGG